MTSESPRSAREDTEGCGESTHSERNWVRGELQYNAVQRGKRDVRSDEVEDRRTTSCVTPSPAAPIAPRRLTTLFTQCMYCCRCPPALRCHFRRPWVAMMRVRRVLLHRPSHTCSHTLRTSSYTSLLPSEPAAHPRSPTHAPGEPARTRTRPAFRPPCRRPGNSRLTRSTSARTSSTDSHSST